MFFCQTNDFFPPLAKYMVELANITSLQLRIVWPNRILLERNQPYRLVVIQCHNTVIHRPSILGSAPSLLFHFLCWWNRLAPLFPPLQQLQSTISKIMTFDICSNLRSAGCCRYQHQCFFSYCQSLRHGPRRAFLDRLFLSYFLICVLHSRSCYRPCPTYCTFSGLGIVKKVSSKR